MSLDIQQREREGVTILDLKGRITVGPEATALREKLASLASVALLIQSSISSTWTISIAPAWAPW